MSVTEHIAHDLYERQRDTQPLLVTYALPDTLSGRTATGAEVFTEPLGESLLRITHDLHDELSGVLIHQGQLANIEESSEIILPIIINAHYEAEEN